MIHETFIVSQLKEDAILGMPFLEKHQCQMNFQKSAEKSLSVLLSLAGPCWAESR